MGSLHEVKGRSENSTAVVEASPRTQSSGSESARRVGASDRLASGPAVARRAVASRAAPLSGAGVLSLQRLAGNRATARLVAQRAPYGDKEYKQVKGHSEGAEGADSFSANFVTNTNNLLGPSSSAASIGTQATGDTMTQGAGGTATSGAAVLVSGASLVTDSISLHHRRRQRAMAKTHGLKGTERAADRQLKIAGGNVATDAGNVVSGVANTVAGGYGIASGLNTASTALSGAAGVTGVVGSSVALPLQLGIMIRQSIRAEYQRQRMARVKKLAEAGTLSKLKGSELAQAKQAAFDREKNEFDRVETELKDLRARHAASKVELDKIAAESEKSKALAEYTGDHEDQWASVPDQLELERQKKAYDENQKLIDQREKDLAAQQKKRDDAEAELKGQHELNKTTGEESGRLDASGKQESEVPSLQEIADYAVRKNRRGFARRTLGAVAGGIGVAGAAVGIAAAVETLKGNSGLGTDLGIGAAAIGGLAAVIGIGVGIWKLVSFVKKRKEQAKKMEEAHKIDSSKPLPKQTYGLVGSNVDATTKRKHMATALYNYAAHGDTEQKKQAKEIILKLDKKLPADAIDNFGKPGAHAHKDTDKYEKDQVIAHLMAKMASGG